MVDNKKIKDVLAQLDPLDDDQWTSDGAPKMETVSALLGEKVTRQDIINASPDFDREKAGKTDEDEGSGQRDPNTTVDQDVTADSENDEKFDYASFIEYLAGVDRDQLEKVSTDLKYLLDKNSKAQDELKEQASKIKTAQAQVKLRIRHEYPNTSDAEATRAYISAQAQARADRMGLRNEVLKGLKPTELDGRSPLDAAMSRKNTRGTGRPNRPLVK